jgi:hypothetical protein
MRTCSQEFRILNDFEFQSPREILNFPATGSTYVSFLLDVMLRSYDRSSKHVFMGEIFRFFINLSGILNPYFVSDLSLTF